jgi:flagella basal body P-ring formation protein FlgA
MNNKVIHSRSKEKMLNPAIRQMILLVVCLIAMPSVTLAQSPVRIDLRPGEIRCFQSVIKLEHVAEIHTGDASLFRKIKSMDVESFGENQNRVSFTKEQVRIRLMLAGISGNQVQISGPDQLAAIFVRQANVRDLVESKLQQQLATQYFMSVNDLKITLDPRFDDTEKSGLDFATLIVESASEAELSLGRQTVSAEVLTQSGESQTIKIPVSIALIRDLVVARKNISKGQTLNEQNIETVRRPVTSRHIRFASFEQAVGKQVQSDVQQYSLIKSNVVQSTGSSRHAAIKKNSLVSIVLRRGPLTVVLKDAKALDSGNPGDQITLLNPRTKEKIVAVVIDSSTAEARF